MKIKIYSWSWDSRTGLKQHLLSKLEIVNNETLTTEYVFVCYNEHTKKVIVYNDGKKLCFDHKIKCRNNKQQIISAVHSIGDNISKTELVPMLKRYAEKIGKRYYELRYAEFRKIVDLYLQNKEV